ncbi:MAG: carbon storage regulator CsrA [Thermodesulfobacteriota bacterium]|nr:carbon storage regulator CsrA [Thermodesulfobacteriota bacterium]
MLVLTRKLGETVTIGSNIKVTVVDVKGKQVRLGIEAPAETVIHREEIYKRIQEENRLAAIGTSIDLNEILNLWRKNKK